MIWDHEILITATRVNVKYISTCLESRYVLYLNCFLFIKNKYLDMGINNFLFIFHNTNQTEHQTALIIEFAISRKIIFINL